MSLIALITTLVILLGVSGVTFIFDPYFHYHAPFDFQRYHLSNQRYQNDGIARHFEYDSIITGTSMTENFKTTEFNELFSKNSIKIPYFGASFKEIDASISNAISRNDKITMVLRSLDHYKLFEDKDTMSYSNYPEYLYDNNPINDVKYLLNKDILLTDTFQTFMMTLKRSESTTFDKYSNWNDSAVFGKEAVLSSYERKEKIETINTLTESDKKTIEDTVQQNFIETAKNNPSIDFYVFIPPYSMVYWDSLYTTGEIERHLNAQELAINLFLKQENIHIFSFMTDYETVCNLDNYKDISHYKEEINSKILQHMSKNEYKITSENCNEYFSEVRSFYTSYDYDSIF